MQAIPRPYSPLKYLLSELALWFPIQIKLYPFLYLEGSRCFIPLSLPTAIIEAPQFIKVSNELTL